MTKTTNHQPTNEPPQDEPRIETLALEIVETLHAFAEFNSDSPFVEEVRRIRERYQELKRGHPQGYSGAARQAKAEFVARKLSPVTGAEQEAARYRAVLEDLAAHGTRHDTNPTMLYDNMHSVAMRFTAHLESMDTAVRERAREPLADSTETGSQAKCEGCEATENLTWQDEDAVLCRPCFEATREKGRNKQ